MPSAGVPTAQVCVEVVELDPAMVEVAQRWFGFTQDTRRMTVHMEDGVGFIKKKATCAKEGEISAHTHLAVVYCVFMLGSRVFTCV